MITVAKWLQFNDGYPIEHTNRARISLVRKKQHVFKSVHFERRMVLFPIECGKYFARFFLQLGQNI